MPQGESGRGRDAVRLLDMGPGWVRVQGVPDADLRIRLLQVGIGEGVLLRVVGVLPGAIRVVEQGQNRWAFGRGIARQIEIQPE